MTGGQLLGRTEEEVFQLWQSCRRSDRVVERIVGRRFLRLDRTIKGYARLSPSIRREFQTYTVLGLRRQAVEIEELSRQLAGQIIKISRAKLDLAGQVVKNIISSLKIRDMVRKKTCFILAGDITYEMAHTEPRLEKSTGRLVLGSDLDLVVVTADTFPSGALKVLDDAIHTRKYYLLTDPAYREEIDYIIKPLSRIEEQMRFDKFEAMVACKILREGVFLSGSEAIFLEVNKLLAKHRIPERLDHLEERAREYRLKAENCLRDLKTAPIESEFSNLFFTKEERLEEAFNGRIY